MPKRDEMGVKKLDYRGMKQASGNYEVVTNTDDISALLDVGIKAMSGKPAKYPATEEGLTAFKNGIVNFFKYIDEKNAELETIEGTSKLIPDTEGMCSFLKISKPTFYTYKRRGGEWEDAIDLAMTTIAAVKKQLSFNYKIPTVLAVFDLCNNHGYMNTSEFRISTQTTPEQEKTALLETKLDESGLIWSEEQQEYIPIEDRGGGEL